MSSLAASVGVFGTGVVIQRLGHFSGFLSMSAAALAAVLVTLFLLPETKPPKYID
jgi:hypothetical protein